MIRRLKNRCMPFFLEKRVGLLRDFHGKREAHTLPAPLVVSLTSYPPRFDKLALTLQSLLAQSVKFDRLVLWIAHSDKHEVPQAVRELENKGLDIRYCEDIRSYKKIIPSLAAFSGSFIVTVDDDAYYWSDWLRELVGSWRSNNEVLCHRAHRIQLDASGLPLPYSSWEFETNSRVASPLIFQTGIGGVLYPPDVFFKDVMEEAKFRSICFTADDIWLYWMMRLKGAVARNVGSGRKIYTWTGTQNEGLFWSNVGGGGNDSCVRAMIEEYGFPGVR